MKRPALYLILFSAFYIPALFTSAQVVFINEVCTSPPASPGSSTNSNSLYNQTETPFYNQEWVELYNPDPCNPVDIGCYTLASNMEPPSGTGISNWGAFTFPAGTIIPPLGFIIIGGGYSQVPTVAFDLTWYRQNTFQSQYLDGYPDRWFLRDEYGWIGLYGPGGVPVDAVFWNAYGNPADLFSAAEYQSNVYTTTACSGSQTLTAARNINNIEFIGTPAPGSYLSFQRTTDGGTTWYNSPVTPSPGSCNGPCVGPPILTAVAADESCAGNDGTISLTITPGGTGPYLINWINPAGLHNSSLSNLTAGVYMVEVVDAFNCFIVYDTITIIKEPDPIVTFTFVNNESCSSVNGSAGTSISNGNAPYSYIWSTNPPQTGSSMQGVPAGSYSVTLTDALGCTATNSLTLINMPGPEISVDSVIHELCTMANGAVFTSVSSGTPPFSYTWNSSPGQSGADLLNVHSGIYTVTISDNNNCTDTASATILNTPPPEVSFTNILNETCNKHDGAATVMIDGGNPPYTFYWSVDSSQAITLTDLAHGYYTITVSDEFCIIDTFVFIGHIPGPIAAFSMNPQVQPLDHPEFQFIDESEGDIILWYWDFGDYHTSYQRNPEHSYDNFGNYTVTLTVEDDRGCTDSATHDALVIDYITLYAPTAFTPNGDHHNDFFALYGQNITNFHIYIYSRWGGLVFESTDLNHGWNGMYNGLPSPDGLYAWVAVYSEDYVKFVTDPKTVKGTVLLYR